MAGNVVNCSTFDSRYNKARNITFLATFLSCNLELLLKLEQAFILLVRFLSVDHPDPGFVY